MLDVYGLVEVCAFGRDVLFAQWGSVSSVLSASKMPEVPGFVGIHIHCQCCHFGKEHLHACAEVDGFAAVYEQEIHIERPLHGAASISLFAVAWSSSVLPRYFKSSTTLRLWRERDNLACVELLRVGLFLLTLHGLSVAGFVGWVGVALDGVTAAVVASAFTTAAATEGGVIRLLAGIISLSEVAWSGKMFL